MNEQANSAELIKRKAQEIGFDLCGIAPAVSPVTWPDFTRWLDAGYAGEMQYLGRRRAAYEHPRNVLPVVRSVIMTAVCYTPRRRTVAPAKGTPSTVVPSTGRMACYAQGERDYHDVLRRMLGELADVLHELFPGCKTRGVVDTAPLLERDFARQAGLGWFGKNTMLINKSTGSYFFLGAVLTDLDLPADEPHSATHCGTCTRCLEVCPTDAFTGPYELDARRCISYQTIEQRSAPIPRELRAGLQDWMFGCDLCQVVCPWNRHAPEPRIAEFQAELDGITAREILTMSEAEFDNRFGSTPLSRPGWQVMRRNAAIVLGNSGDAEMLPILRQYWEDPHPLVRGACLWAVAMLEGPEATSWLETRAESDPDPDIRSDLATLLAQWSTDRETPTDNQPIT